MSASSPRKATRSPSRKKAAPKTRKKHGQHDPRNTIKMLKANKRMKPEARRKAIATVKRKHNL